MERIKVLLSISEVSAPKFRRECLSMPHGFLELDVNMSNMMETHLWGDNVAKADTHGSWERRRIVKAKAELLNVGRGAEGGRHPARQTTRKKLL